MKAMNSRVLKEYTIVLLAILCSGTVIFNIEYNSIFIPFFVLMSILLGAKNLKITLKNKVNIILICLIVFFNMLLHIFDGIAVNGVLQILFYAVGTYFMSQTMTFDRYKSIYIKCVVALAVISMTVFFSVNAGVLPHHKVDINSASYQISFLHIVGWSDTVFNTRMCGLFHEPGMYQIILNLALLFAVDRTLEGTHEKKDILEIIILVIAVILTRSTAGYIVMAIIVGILYVLMLKNTKKIWVKVFSIMCIPVVVMGLMELLKSDVIATKFVSSNVSFGIRSNDLISGVIIALKNAVIGLGYNSTTYDTIASNYGMSGISNGLIGTAIMFGIPSMVLMCVMILHCVKRQTWNVKKIVVILILIIEEMIESSFFFPIFLVFMFPFIYDKCNTEKRGKEFLYEKTIYGRRGDLRL